MNIYQIQNISDIPKDKSFTYTWKYNNQQFSKSFQFDGKQFTTYDRKKDDFKPAKPKEDLYGIVSLKGYIIIL